MKSFTEIPLVATPINLARHCAIDRSTGASIYNIKRFATKFHAMISQRAVWLPKIMVAIGEKVVKESSFRVSTRLRFQNRAFLAVIFFISSAGIHKGKKKRRHSWLRGENRVTWQEKRTPKSIFLHIQFRSVLLLADLFFFMDTRTRNSWTRAKIF